MSRLKISPEEEARLEQEQIKRMISHVSRTGSLAAQESGLTEQERNGCFYVRGLLLDVNDVPFQPSGRECSQLHPYLGSAADIIADRIGRTHFILERETRYYAPGIITIDRKQRTLEGVTLAYTRAKMHKRPMRHVTIISLDTNRLLYQVVSEGTVCGSGILLQESRNCRVVQVKALF